MRNFLTNFILRDINVVDVEKGEIKTSNVYIKNNIICDVTESLDLSYGFQEINCKNKYLIPGIIDCHVNIISTYDNSKIKNINSDQIKKNLNKALSSGITSIRDLYAPLNLVNNMKSKIKKYSEEVPDVYFSASLSDENDDFFLNYRKSLINRVENLSTKLRTESLTNNIEFDRNMTSEQMESYVWKLVETGLDSVRVGNRFSRLMGDLSLPSLLENEKLKVIVNTAHKYNKKVSLNVSYLDDLKRAIDFEITSIEGSITDKVIDNQTLSLIKEKGIYVSPLINVIGSMLNLDELISKVEADNDVQLEKSVKKNILSQLEALRKDDKFKEFIHRAYDTAQTNLGKLIEFDIPIVMGTGAGDTYNFFGEYFKELKEYKKCGLSNLKILQSATIESAKLLGIEKETATIKQNKYADLLLLKNNPLENYENLKSIEVIFKDGKSYDPEIING